MAIIALAVVDIGKVHNGVRADPDPLQDFCVADLEAGGPFANGYPCKAAELVTTEDFPYSKLGTAANLTGNPVNGTATFGAVREWPALNTLGLALARLDIDPCGIIMPHTHYLATEILCCLEGDFYTGFVTKNDNPSVPNKLYAKIVKKGEAITFPRSLLRFQLNQGTVLAVALNELNSHNPGIQLVPVAVFRVGINPDAQVEKLGEILSQFASVFA